MSDIAWSLPRRIGFRLLFSYSALFVYQLPINLVPGIPVSVVNALAWPLDQLTRLVGRACFSLTWPDPLPQTGSGDTSHDYVGRLVTLLLALIATLVWSLADRRRHDHRVLAAWLRVGVRWMLFYVMASYGLVKVIKMQFPTPSGQWLAMPLGDHSPMGLLWSFMGASTSYTMFGGAMELLGGLLLLGRRTTTLGAMVCTMVMTNVFMLNLCYDVPVKLLSLHLLLASLWLLAHDARRLFALLVLNRAVPAATHVDEPHLERRGLRVGARVLTVLVAGLTLVLNTLYALHGYREGRGDGAPAPRLAGRYEVLEQHLDGEMLPPLWSDGRRWQWLVVDKTGVTFYGGDRVAHGYVLEREDPSTGTLALHSKDDAARPAEVRLQPIPGEPDRLRLTGRVDGHEVDAVLLPRPYLLRTRGFSLVSPHPFNR